MITTKNIIKITDLLENKHKINGSNIILDFKHPNDFEKLKNFTNYSKNEILYISEQSQQFIPKNVNNFEFLLENSNLDVDQDSIYHTTIYTMKKYELGDILRKYEKNRAFYDKLFRLLQVFFNLDLSLLQNNFGDDFIDKYFEHIKFYSIFWSGTFHHLKWIFPKIIDKITDANELLKYLFLITVMSVYPSCFCYPNVQINTYGDLCFKNDIIFFLVYCLNFRKRDLSTYHNLKNIISEKIKSETMLTNEQIKILIYSAVKSNNMNNFKYIIKNFRTQLDRQELFEIARNNYEFLFDGVNFELKRTKRQRSVICQKRGKMLKMLGIH